MQPRHDPRTVNRLRSLALLLGACAVVILSASGAGAKPGVSGLSTTRLHHLTGPGPEAAPGPSRGQTLALAEPRDFLARVLPSRPITPPGAPSGFFNGLLSGLFGAGIAGAIAGQGLTSGLTGFPGFLGLAIQLVLLAVGSTAGLVVVRRLSRGMSPAFAHGGGGWSLSPSSGRRPGPRFAARGRGTTGRAGHVTLTASDFAAFEKTLRNVQAAWSRQDIPALQALCTYDMVQHYADALARLASRNLKNQTRDVVLEQGDIAETWREGDTSNVSLAITYSLVDVTRRATDNVVMIGDPVRRVQATEVWTFVRHHGSDWRLSAVQQAH